jgi:hypothetical protein
MSKVIEAVQPHVADKGTRKQIYGTVVDELLAYDWDDESDCMGQDVAYDELIKDRHPSWFDETS